MRKDLASSENALNFTCIICSKEKELVSVGICDHRRVCSYCAMKSRLHYDYKKCPICLKILDEIYICEFNDKTPYQTLITKKDEFYKDEEFEKCGIYYTTEEGKEEALNLRGFNCPIRNCHSESFENINSLSEHLNKVHEKYYCQYCLKENKLFLSEMNIYNQSNLNDHIKYGEYDNNNLVSPPHPSCPFDDSTFYNDGQLFTHMNSSHFICQLCKDKQNIIFYPELKNLLAHYKSNHFCCPYEECLADIYIVFTKKSELISHLITKHNIQNANEKLNKLIYDRQNDEKKEIHHEKGEFNFSEYVKDLKEQSEYYRNSNKNKFVNLNDKYNDEGIEIEYKYVDDNHNHDNYNNYNNSGYKKNRGNDYYGRGGKNHKRGGKNNYNNHNNDWNNKSNQNHINEYNEQNDNNNNDSSDYSNKNGQKNYKGKYYNNKEGGNYHKHKKYIDYSILFSFYLTVIKEIITNKIKTENIEDKLVRLPKERIYQITIMIDKLESYDKLLELTYLNYFGIEFDIHEKLKNAISSSTPENEKTFKEIIENLELKNQLIIYKYLDICTKKVNNSFYRLDLEQINEDLYEDFCEREKEEEHKVLDKYERIKRNRQACLKAQLNMGIKMSKQDKKVSEINKNNKKEDKKEGEPLINKPKSKISKLLNNDDTDIKENNNNIDKKGKKKKGKGHFVDFNIRDFI